MQAHRRRRVAAIFVGIGLAVSLGYCAASADSHHTNLNYLIWKQGWSPTKWRQNYHLFLVDDDMQHRLVGKSAADLGKWFPDLVPASHGNRLQTEALSGVPAKDGDMVWVGEMLEGFKLSGGRFVGIVHYDKG